MSDKLSPEDLAMWRDSYLAAFRWMNVEWPDASGTALKMADEAVANYKSRQKESK